MMLDAGLANQGEVPASGQVERSELLFEGNDRIGRPVNHDHGNLLDPVELVPGVGMERLGRNAGGLPLRFRFPDVLGSGNG